MRACSRYLHASLLAVPLLLSLAPPHAALAQVTAADWLASGQAKAKKGDHEGALADLSRAITIDPTREDAFISRAVVYDQMADWKSALADYDSVIALNPNSRPAFIRRGIDKMRLDQVPAALVDLSHAIDLGPPVPEFYVYRAEALALAGKMPDALADLNHALELDPKNAPAFNVRGKWNFQQGNWKQALEDFHQVCELRPEAQDYPQINIWLAHMLLTQKDAAAKDLAFYLQNRTTGKKGDWPSTVASFLLGTTTEADFLAAAAAKNPTTDLEQHCEAWFYAGMKRLLADDKTTAADDFRKCLATGVKSFTEYQFADTQLKALPK